MRYRSCRMLATPSEHGLLLHHGKEFLIIEVPLIPINDEMVAIFIFYWKVHVTMLIHEVHVPMLVHMLHQVIALKWKGIRVLVDCFLNLPVQLIVVEAPSTVNQLLNLSVVIVLSAAVVVVEVWQSETSLGVATTCKYISDSGIIILIVDTSQHVLMVSHVLIFIIFVVFPFFVFLLAITSLVEKWRVGVVQDLLGERPDLGQLVQEAPDLLVMSQILVSMVIIIEDVVFPFNVDHHVWVVGGGDPRDLTRLIHELVLRVDLFVPSEGILVSKLSVYLDAFGLGRPARACPATSAPLLFPHALLLLPCG